MVRCFTWNKMWSRPVKIATVTQNNTQTYGFVCTRCLKIPSKCGCGLQWEDEAGVDPFKTRKIEPVADATGFPE